MKLRPGLLLAFAFVFMTTMTSCVRDYICQCEITYTGHPALPDNKIREYDIKDSKKNAEKICTENSGQWEHGEIVTREECILF